MKPILLVGEARGEVEARMNAHAGTWKIRGKWTPFVLAPAVDSPVECGDILRGD